MKKIIAYIVAAITYAILKYRGEIKRENKYANEVPDVKKSRINKLRAKYNKRVHGKSIDDNE